MGAAVAGLVIQQLIGAAVPVLLYVKEIGVFLVILAVIASELLARRAMNEPDCGFVPALQADR